MTTKKPKAPAKKTAAPKKPATGKKPSLSQQKRLKALRSRVVAPPAPVARTEAPTTFRDLSDEHERALEKRIPYPEPLGAAITVHPYPSDLHAKATPPLPAAQKRDKRLLYAAIGVVALGVVVYYGGFL